MSVALVNMLVTEFILTDHCPLLSPHWSRVARSLLAFGQLSCKCGSIPSSGPSSSENNVPQSTPCPWKQDRLFSIHFVAFVFLVSSQGVISGPLTPGRQHFHTRLVSEKMQQVFQQGVWCGDGCSGCVRSLACSAVKCFTML